LGLEVHLPRVIQEPSGELEAIELLDWAIKLEAKDQILLHSQNHVNNHPVQLSEKE
jgi:hypothetical protein